MFLDALMINPYIFYTTDIKEKRINMNYSKNSTVYKLTTLQALKAELLHNALAKRTQSNFTNLVDKYLMLKK